MSNESHNTIARRIIAEYKQDSEAFKKKYGDRPDLIKLMDNPSKQAEFLALASTMDMATDNPIQAFENYPEIFSLMNGAVNGMDAFEFANIIQKAPEKFHEWKAEINTLFGKTKIRKIKELLIYHDVIISDDFYNILSPIVQKTLDGIREELIEQQQYWVSELGELEDNNNSLQNSTDVKTRAVIIESFFYKGKTDWEFAFRNENDFNKFIETLIAFFTGEEYDLSKTISLKPRCKTRLARILREIHKNLSEDNLRSDGGYLDVVRILSPYKDDPNLYETLTK